MSKMVQIRNVPDALHRKLKARAATSGQTLYDKLTDLVDALSGMVGKKTALGKEIRAIRKQLNDAGNASGDEGSGSGSDSGSGSGSGSDSGSS